MRRHLIIVVGIAVLGALALPGAASADVNNGEDCSYTADEQVSQGAGPLVVYADADGGGGMTGTATASGGVCANGLGAGGLDGGAAEAGAGTPAGGPGTYGVIDGDNNNVDPANQSDGYAGLSNYETSPPRNVCDNPPGGGGSNGGGCIGIDTVAAVPVAGSPIVCGNSSGNTWVNTTRDGCSLP